jgi:muramidase (phage lysozyme)
LLAPGPIDPRLYALAMRQAAAGTLNLSPDAGLSPDDGMAPHQLAAKVLADYIAANPRTGAGQANSDPTPSGPLVPSQNFARAEANAPDPSAPAPVADTADAIPTASPGTGALSAESAAVPASAEVPTSGSSAVRPVSDAGVEVAAAIPAPGPGPGALTKAIPPLPSGPGTLASALVGGSASAQVQARNTSIRALLGPIHAALDPAGQSSRLSAGPDPLVWAIARYNPKLIPPGYVVNPETGEVSRWRLNSGPSPSAPALSAPGMPGSSVPTLEPLSPADKQRFLEQITGAAEGPLGTLSSQEQWSRGALERGLIPGIPRWAKLKAPDAKEQGLLDFIAQQEGAGDDTARQYHFSSAYDVPYLYGPTPKPLTQMTLREVGAFQDDLLQRTGSTAVGRYQFLKKTLDHLKGAFKLADDDVFTPELQDRLGLALLKEDGLDGYRVDKNKAVQFRNGLAGTWASIPLYGTDLNRGRKTRASDGEVRAAMRPLGPS